MNKWDMNNLCEPRAAEMKRSHPVADQLRSDHQGLLWWNGTSQILTASWFIRLANRVPVLLYMIMSNSANLPSPWPRVNFNWYFWVPPVIFSEWEGLQQFYFFPECVINSFFLCHVLDWIGINQESKKKWVYTFTKLPKFSGWQSKNMLR